MHEFSTSIRNTEAEIERRNESHRSNKNRFMEDNEEYPVASHEPILPLTLPHPLRQRSQMTCAVVLE